MQYALYILTLILGLVVLHTAALIKGWYVSVVWFDVLTHIWGGFFVGALAVYIYYYAGAAKSLHTGAPFILYLSVSSALLAGVLWEFYEFLLDTHVRTAPLLSFQGGVPDTMGDLFFDMCGGALAALIYVLWLRRV